MLTSTAFTVFLVYFLHFFQVSLSLSLSVNAHTYTHTHTRIHCIHVHEMRAYIFSVYSYFYFNWSQQAHANRQKNRNFQWLSGHQLCTYSLVSILVVNNIRYWVFSFMRCLYFAPIPVDRQWFYHNSAMLRMRMGWGFNAIPPTPPSGCRSFVFNSTNKHITHEL